MTTPVRFVETIMGIMQDDEICVVHNALEMSATAAASVLTEICPIKDLVFRPTLNDEDLLVYYKRLESQPEYKDAIKTICGEKYVG